MAAIESTMLALGTQAPEFTLPDTISGKTLSLNELKSDKATVIMFICNHCPYVKHVREELIRLPKEYRAKGVSFVGISSNDADAYPDDAPEELKKAAEEYGYAFPFLYDESQDAAKAYSAACTPDFFIFDKNLKLVYRGQLDDSRPGNNIPVNGSDIRAALDNILSGQPVNKNQKPSIGCSIKWKE